MSGPRTDSLACSRSPWLFAMIGLALLAGGLVIADDASAANIEAVQSYVWADSDTSDRGSAAQTTENEMSDSLDHLWVPVPHQTLNERSTHHSNSDNITEIPQDGFLLVGVDYEGSGTDQITFRLVDGSTEHEYQYVVGADPGEDDRNVWLADEALDLQQSGSATFQYTVGIDAASTGDDGCGGTSTDGASALLTDRDSTDTPCWFLIELQNPDAGGTPTSGTDKYFLEVEVQDDVNVTERRERMDDSDTGGHPDQNDPERDLTMTSPVASIDSVSLTPRVDGASDTVQTGRPLTVNVTASTSNSGTGRAPQWGDVDAWVCLFEDGENEVPYTGFAAWKTLESGVSGWDDPAACEFLDYPTHGQPSQDADANTINIPSVDDHIGDSDRFFEASVTFDVDELEQTGSSFTDDFYTRVILRDPVGNIQVDDRTSSDPGTFKVARYDVEQDVREINVDPSGDAPTTTEFANNEGCFYDGGAQDEGFTFTPSSSSPCLIGREFAPPNQVFTFPVTIENYGNVEDEVTVDFENPSNAGSTDWTVQLFAPDGSSSKDSITVTVPAATPAQSGETKRSTITEGETTIEVRMTPKSTSLAVPDLTSPTTSSLGSQGQRTINLEAESDRAANTTRVDRFLQSQLVENAQGTIALGDSGDTTVTVDAKTDQTTEISLDVENTGNTNGPFKVQLSNDASTTCRAIGETANADEIELSFKSDLPDQGSTILPGKTKSFTLQVEPQTNVPIGDYDCELDLADGSGGDPISLVTTDPTVRVSVTGVPDIRIWDVRGADNEEVEITGENVTIPVRPDGDTADVYLYLENVGDVALEPELISSVNDNFLQRDKFGLAGTWEGVDDVDGGTVSLGTAEAPFNLPVSDGNDSSEVKIRDLFDFTADPRTDDSSDNQQETDLWYCAGDDATGDSDTDERAVCQLHFQYDFADRNAVSGDLVIAKFRYQDSGGDGDPSQVTIKLDFGHVGTVEATSVPEKVLGDGQSTTPVFQASLDQPHRFDPDASEVDARLEASFPGTTCSGSEGVSSSSESLRSATFRPEVTLNIGSSCSVSNTDGGPIEVTVPSEGPVGLLLQVEDENATQIRQVHPATIKVQNTDPPTVSQPSSFSIDPAQELDADGNQWASLTFDPGSDGDGFPNEAGEGLLLTRKSSTNGLEPFVDCSLGDQAVSVGAASTPLEWTVERADPAGDFEYLPDGASDQQHVVPATEPAEGLILQNERINNEDRATTIGDVTLWGWSSTGAGSFTWTEGWNPLVLRVVDDEGRPAQGPDASSSVDLNLELRFVVRDDPDGDGEEEITDAYELSSQDGTIRTRALGNGFFGADIYLPAGLSGANELGDYNSSHDVSVQSVYREAFALHAEITSGESTGGEDLRGDAFWQLGELGLIDSTSAQPEVGTTGSPDVGTGLIDVRSKLTQGTIGPDDTASYLHASPQFNDALMSRGGSTWTTGPGVQDYGVFVMEERSDPQDDDRRFNGSDAISDDYRDHTFSPATNAELDLVLRGGGNRFDVPGADTYSLSATQDDGFFSSFIVLPDSGQETFQWDTDLRVYEDQQAQENNQEAIRFFKSIETKESFEPSVNGLPMPLCLREPANAFDEGTDPAGDFDDTEVGNRKIVDLRAVPGLLVDRGGFAMAPLIENSAGGVHFDVNSDATFNVVGDSLLSLSASQLPTSGETGREIPITVSPTPTSAVSEVTATLRLNGTTEDSATLVGPDSDGRWKGSVTPPEAGSYTLRVSATDTGGGVEAVSSTVEVQANSPPSITIVDPAEVEGERAMPSNGEIEATIADNLITADAITLEEKIGSSDGQQGTVLSNSDVTFDSLTDQPTVGEHSITVNFSDVETGTAYVNVTGMPGENMTASISSNESSGTIKFNETGAATVTVQTNGTNGVDTSFDVQVQSTGGDGFSEVDLGSDAISCEGTSCTLTYSPSGLSDGDTYTFKIVANISEDDKSTKGPVDVTVDDGTPSVSISIGTPKGAGSPTRVGTQTSLTVEASDNVLIESVILGARKGGVETGTQSFQGGTANVTGEVNSLSQLGLDSSGTATLNATVIDIAGNEDTARVEVRIDGEGPSLSGAALEAQGSGLRATVSADDPAGVDTVQLLVKKPGETTFKSNAMQQASGGEYSGSVSSPGNSGTLEYYFRATDELGNEKTLGSQSNPRTFDLSSVSLENAPPEVSVVSPGPDERVSGTFDLTLELSDPDAGDTVEVESVLLTPSSGDEVSVDLPSDLSGDTEVTVPVGTTDVAEGRTIIEVEVSDGTDTSTAQRTVFVDNLLDPCEDSPKVSGGEVTFCLTFTPAGNVTDVQMELVREGETIATAPAECDGSVCRATFPEGDVPSDAPVRPDLVVTTEDGQTQRHQGEIQSLGGALSPDEPLGRFVTTLVLGVATMGAAAYAGFRRWG